MRKTQSLLALFSVLTLSLGSCDIIDDIFGSSPDSSYASSQSSSSVESTRDSESSASDSNTSSASSSTAATSATERRFAHTFIADDFKKSMSGSQLSAGELTVNGLTFSYSAANYLAQHNSGIQLGSKNKPQTIPFTLTASLPEGTVVTGWSATVENASGGAATLKTVAGEHSFTQDFDHTQGNHTIFESGLNAPATSFTFSFQAKTDGRAIYFYELSISLHNEAGLSDSITDDSGATRDPVVPGQGDIPSTNYELTTEDIYYADVDLTQTGEALELSLRQKISDHKVLSYGDAKHMLLYTDESLDRPGYDYGMWDGDYIAATWTNGGSWQREHVWAASHLGLPDGEDGHDDREKGAQSDLHNLRVACGSSNNYHSNRYFADQDSAETADKEGYFFPNVDTSDNLSGIHEYQGDWRGDTARIVFYMATMYDNLNVTDTPDDSPVNSMGLLFVLLKWNTEDPVDAFERQRNERIFEYQGNRNPFIDHPELVNKIWNK